MKTTLIHYNAYVTVQMLLCSCQYNICMCTDNTVQMSPYRCCCTDVFKMLLYMSLQMSLYRSHCTDPTVQMSPYRCCCTDVFKMLLYMSLQMSLYRSHCTDPTVQMSHCGRYLKEGIGTQGGRSHARWENPPSRSEYNCATFSSRIDRISGPV